MVLRPRDYTAQEEVIADCLSEFGMRYNQQHEILSYLADFWIPELKLVIEADGVYGHLKKRDAERDKQLLEKGGVDTIIHIKQTTMTDIKEELWQALNRL